MKVLFAVNNESISESIVKKYQKDYREIISYKNVYYFNAILKEIQKDKFYDRIVISEDLEPFANNNYDAIDKFLFEKLDSISDEATIGEGRDTPIILICTDRRTKGESMLVKLFGLGVYNALIGQDRSIDEVCKLINKPRIKKEAKIYYKIDVDDVNYQNENENDVSETEIQNILTHYKKLGKNEERFVDSFNNIASQYTDQQLKIIIKFLPLNVKAVLEANSPKYQELVTFADGGSQVSRRKVEAKRIPETKKIQATFIDNKPDTNKKNPMKLGLFDKGISKPLSKPVVIPSALNMNGNKKFEEPEEEYNEPEYRNNQNNENNLDELDDLLDNIQPESNMKVDNSSKYNDEDRENDEENIQEIVEEPVKRGRGRPKKAKPQEIIDENKPKKGRGRPRKNQPEPDLFNLADQEEAEDDDDEIEESNVVLPDADLEEYEETENNSEQRGYVPPVNRNNLRTEERPKQEMQPASNYGTYQTFSSSKLDNLLTKDKKIVCFVGTTKNGTSFVLNNLALLLSTMNINTAILDMTENRNSYYIYTKNDENLRKIAYNSIDKLRSGIAEGIKVNRNLTVFTALPGDDKPYYDAENILSTLVQNYSLVLIDCDFKTVPEYFFHSQEIYLIQSMDVLTIQPLTAFLRDLKAKNALDEEKIRVIINKETKVRGLNPRTLVGGMAFYNDPAMTFMTELFNKDIVRYYTLPFDEQVYDEYLEALINCNISINRYPKEFLEKLKTIGNIIYPLLGKPAYGSKMPNNYQGTNFSNSTYNTLNAMKKRF